MFPTIARAKGRVVQSSRTIGLAVLLVFTTTVARPGATHADEGLEPAVNEGSAERAITLFPIIKNRKMGFIDQHGRVVIEPAFELERAGEGPYPLPRLARAIADTPPKEVYDAPNAYPMRFPKFHDGVAIVGREGLVGYIRRDGKVLSPPKFLAASHFTKGVAWVQLQDTTFCLINLGMEPLIEHIEESPCQFQEGLAPVKVEGKFGYIDRRGTMVIPPRYDSASAFSEGLALVTAAAAQWLIDAHGQVIAVLDSDLEAYPFSQGLAVVRHRTTNMRGYIDASGEQVIAPKFERAIGFQEGLAPVQLDGKWGYIDRCGKFAIEPWFCSASGFVRGQAIVRMADPARPTRELAGIVDRRGQFIVKPQFSSIYTRCDGFYIADFRQLIDVRGTPVLESRFRRLEFTDDAKLIGKTDKGLELLDFVGNRYLVGQYSEIALDVSEGLRAVGKMVDGQHKYGFVDVGGNMVIPPQFDYAENFDHGLARVAVDVDVILPYSVQGGAWGYIDREGNWVWQPTR